MTDLYYGINQTGYSIMNQLSKQIAEAFLDRIDALRFVNNNLFITNPMTGIGLNTDVNRNPLVTTDRVDGKAEFILDPASVPWPSRNRFSSPGVFASHIFNTEYPKLWEDKSRGLVLREQSVPAAITYDLTITTQTNDAAIRIWDQIKRAVMGDVTTFNFDLSYSYPVTTYIFEYFISTWLLRKGYRDQGKSLLQYMNDFALERISYDFRKSELGTDHPDMQLLIRRRQLFCQAKITCDGTGPQDQRVGNAVDCYTIPITLQVQFARPFQLIGTLPVVIDNQFVNGKLFEKVQVTENQNLEATTTSEWQRGFFQRTFPGFRIDHAMMILPTWDDETFMDSLMQSLNFVPFFQVAFTLDGDVTEIDLKNINGVGLHPIVKDIMLKQKADIFNFEGLFNIRVFVNDVPMESPRLTLSDDFVLSVPSCGLDKRYHLVISEATQVELLNAKYYSAIMDYRYFFPLTISRNLKAFIQQGYFTIGSGTYLLTVIQNQMSSKELPAILLDWISVGVCTDYIYQYCCNAAQFADYITNTLCKKQGVYPTQGSVTGLVTAKAYLDGLSTDNPKTLYQFFIASLLAQDVIDMTNIPAPYLLAGYGYPYTTQPEMYYGFTTPLRIIHTGFECQ